MQLHTDGHNCRGPRDLDMLIPVQTWFNLPYMINFNHSLLWAGCMKARTRTNTQLKSRERDIFRNTHTHTQVTDATEMEGVIYMEH